MGNPYGLRWLNPSGFGGALSGEASFDFSECPVFVFCVCICNFLGLA